MKAFAYLIPALVVFGVGFLTGYVSGPKTVANPQDAKPAKPPIDPFIMLVLRALVGVAAVIAAILMVTFGLTLAGGVLGLG